MVGNSSKKAALTIAGFDPSGGAGVLADVQTLAAHGLHAQACITISTVQSTAGVRAVRAEPAAWIGQTLACLAQDNPFDVIKIGALGDAASAGAIADFLSSQAGVPVVLDPVLRSSSGTALLDEAGVAVLRDRILPLVSWVTPNFAELAILAGWGAAGRGEVEIAAKMLQKVYPKINVVVTGGDSEKPDDFVFLAGQSSGQWVEGQRVVSRAGHGTGCTFSSALAARLALFPLEPSIDRVRACKRYVEGAIQHAPGIGRGAGPLGWFWQSQSE